ncbi:MAG: hypothetical protein K2O52_02955 [Oscillospiraceae bacterium]|nr:hypothetical protein [Oscillospiraceae bacterium]
MNRLVEIIYLDWEEDLKDTDPRRIARETLCDNAKEVAMLDSLLHEERKEAFEEGFREAIQLLID